MSADLARLRADVDWLIERNPIAAARLEQAIACLEHAEVLEKKAGALLHTVAPALIDRLPGGGPGPGANNSTR